MRLRKNVVLLAEFKRILLKQYSKIHFVGTGKEPSALGALPDPTLIKEVYV